MSSFSATPSDRRERTQPKLALTRREAASLLSVSVDYFDQHIRPELRVVRRGRRVLFPFAELELWLERNAARSLPGQRAA
jgi:excisionase family DNA binding protein